ncbi:hypothetical protein FPQ18DRAFT_44067 [Pyronema domesticum]|uniref:Similar to Uncharacterized protein C553.12c acc. no. O74949 n=1 Tax=Pyronema omphalodes (strain CBS 100304) TaxID=1076935 RepID=U4LEZ5_PYROM|nr:hypothetical protein FPQ18DRAFT_44067 [Pyronema domesticum]CCX30694.1 Similar to Uncharacterized protein C553.12c; acc. no. O74949 [Pyronema omphalodes CBS 100304]
MHSFFQFQQGNDSRFFPPPETESVRYGRFRAFATDPKRGTGGFLSVFGELGEPPGEGGNNRPPPGYGSINISTGYEEEESDEDENPDTRFWLDRKIIAPRKRTVKHIINKWYCRWAYLIFLPAVVSIVWCMIPFPTYPLEHPPDIYHQPDTPDISTFKSLGHSLFSHIITSFKNIFNFSILLDAIRSWYHSLRNSFPGDDTPPAAPPGAPGHGHSQVAINFWFFLFVYYSFYNLVGLLWITKIFNMYSLNWWPHRLGFPPTFTFFCILPLMVGAALHRYLPAPIITQNLTWIILTFLTMLSPLLVSSLLLLFSRRRNLRSYRGQTETQLLFSSATRMERFSRPGWRWRTPDISSYILLPASYHRFLWFCLSLLLSLVAFVLGEAYAELYLRTLPHNSLETVFYVYSWVATIHLLDAITGFILSNKVGSHPLSFVFKLYFSLTYQTYVRALYARLRSPKQFIYLQLLSSGIVVIWNPITITRAYHQLLTWAGITTCSYQEWQTSVGRAFYIRGLAEQTSMLAFLGWVVGLHFGGNKEVYPYFSFETAEGGYTFQLTFWASLATGACEVAAGWIVRRILRYGWGMRVTKAAKREFLECPELLPACVMCACHVLQNMVVCIVRLRFG